MRNRSNLTRPAKIILAVLLLASCQDVPIIQPSHDPIQSLTKPVHNTPVPITPSHTPTSQPTETDEITSSAAIANSVLTPILVSTQSVSPAPHLLPEPLASSINRHPLAPSNASRLQLLGSISNALPQTLNWSSATTAVAVTHETGLHIYDINRIRETEIAIPRLTLPVFAPGEIPNIFATASSQGTVYIGEINSGTTSVISSKPSPVLHISFDAGVNRIAVLREDNTLTIWSLGDRILLATINLSRWEPVHSHIDGLMFSPDGSTLAVISKDISVIGLWDSITGQPIRTLKWADHAGPLYEVMFSPDWSTIAWVSRATIQLMDYESGATTVSLDHEDAVSSWEYSPTGNMLAVRSSESINHEFLGVVKIWDTSDGRPLHTLVHPGFVSSLTFSSTWELAASASNHGKITIWDMENGSELAVLDGHTTTVWDLDFSPDASLLASGSDDGSIRLWDLETEASLTTIDNHIAPVFMTRFTPDGHTLVSAAEDGTLHIWGAEEVSSQKIAISPNNAAALAQQSYIHAGQAISLAFSEGALASGSQDGIVTLWDPVTGIELVNITGHAGWVYGLSFSPDGSTLASSGQDGLVAVWDTNTGANILTINAQAGEISSVAYSSDGSLLATGSQDGSVDFWDSRSGERVNALAGHSQWVWDVAFSPDGLMLASASADRTVKLWDIPSGQEHGTLTGHTSAVLAVTIAEDGTTLASGSWDGTSKLWDIKSGLLLHTLSGHTDWIYDVAFSPDGKLLASTSRDGSFILWDVPIGLKLLSETSSVTKAFVWSTSFSPNGELLATASISPGEFNESAIRLWGIPD